MYANLLLGILRSRKYGKEIIENRFCLVVLRLTISIISWLVLKTVRILDYKSFIVKRKCYETDIVYNIYEKFEDTKGVIRTRKL